MRGLFILALSIDEAEASKQQVPIRLVNQHLSTYLAFEIACPGQI